MFESSIKIYYIYLKDADEIMIKGDYRMNKMTANKTNKKNPKHTFYRAYMPSYSKQAISRLIF